LSVAPSGHQVRQSAGWVRGSITSRSDPAHGSAFHVQRIWRRALAVKPVTGLSVRPAGRPTLPPSQGAGPRHWERSRIPPGVDTTKCRRIPTLERGSRAMPCTVGRGCDAQRADFGATRGSGGHQWSVTVARGRQWAFPDVSSSLNLISGTPGLARRTGARPGAGTDADDPGRSSPSRSVRPRL